MSRPDFVIATDRTWIVATPVAALESRIDLDDFFLDLEIDAAVVPVRFPPEWLPGDLDDLRAVLERRRANPQAPRPWTGTVIDRARREAVGQIGCLDVPDAARAVEVRYATNLGDRDRGYATEAGAAFVDWLLERPEVESVVAECLVTNAASVRVLEKTGFEPLDEREDDEGRLLRWVKRAA
ncbi:MAG: GNAT family N-acetyltransferase [Trueperaceae bacterium]|nr:GNAT family N-acetyltransferase [Trueperaceae bacterium]